MPINCQRFIDVFSALLYGCVLRGHRRWRQRQQSWDFWIDRGGTFTDIVGRRPGRHADRAQAAVGEPGGLCRRRRAGHPRPARPESRRADPGRPHRRGEDGHHRRHQRAARAQGRAHAAAHHQGFPRRAQDRLPGAAEDLRPAHHQAGDAVRARGRSRRARARRRHGRARTRSRRGARAISKRRKRRRHRRGRDRASCTPIAIPSTRSASRRSRASWASRRSRSATRSRR